MNDLIDRQAALEAMDTWDKFGCDPNGKLVRCDDNKRYIPYVHYEDMVHAIKNLPSAQPDNDMIHLQKEQAYLQGWEEGREALRREMGKAGEVEE